MKIAYVFDLEIAADARAQKEIDAFARAGADLRILEWNKDERYAPRRKAVRIRGRDMACDSVGIPVRKTEGIRSNLVPLLRYERTLFRWLRKNRKAFDVIHCVNLDTAYVCRLFGRLYGKPYVYDIFDDYADAHQCEGRLYRLIKKIDFRVIRDAKKVLICSEKRREQIWGNADNLEVIYNAPDIRPADAKREQDRFTVVYAGNLTEHRMIPELMEAVARHPEWQLEIGGDGALAEEVAREAAGHGNIRVRGRMPYEDVISLEQQGDVIPALYDPALRNNAYAAPNKVFEAMSLGKPTVMVRGTGMDELVERERTGLVIEACSADALEKALLAIREKQTEWQAEAERIRKLFYEKYSWEKMEEKLLKIYGLKQAQKDGAGYGY